MFEAAVDNIALGGRIVAIGMVGSYTAGANGEWVQSRHEARKSALFHALDSFRAAQPAQVRLPTVSCLRSTLLASPSHAQGLTEKLMFKSVTLVGFYLPAYARHFQRTITRLCELHESGELKARELRRHPYERLRTFHRINAGPYRCGTLSLTWVPTLCFPHVQVTIDPAGPFTLESAVDAVEHVQSGKSAGKVVVRVRGLSIGCSPNRKHSSRRVHRTSFAVDFAEPWT